MIKWIFRWTFRILAVLVLGVLAFDLLVPPIYRFPPAEPFAGPRWYNPYSGIEGDPLRCVTHAHAVAWMGVADREQPVEKVWGKYRELGYDAVSITSYMRISEPPDKSMIHIPGYEHGYGVSQRHKTVLGARSVSWLNFWFLHGSRSEQMLIDHLRGISEMVFLNHPDKIPLCLSHGEMEKLTGYTGVEVASRFTRDETHWDAALSAGRPVWGICSDDCHEWSWPNHTSRGWLRVFAGERTLEGFFQAVRAGRFYGVWRNRHLREPNSLRSLTIENGVLRVVLERPATRIRFVGQDGVERLKVKGVTEAEYVLREDDTYVRVVAANAGEEIRDLTVLYLNPVFRFEDSPLIMERPQVLVGATWGLRIGGGLVFLLALRFVFRRTRRRED